MSAPPLDLAIVTSCHGYGRYLAEWADSILASPRRPALVALVDAGLPADVAAVGAARARLEAAGLPVATHSLPGERNLGALRNAAVALAASEWVMHLDADDLLMPHCLDDVAVLAPRADVVALGYERCGDLASGPRNRVKLYKSSQGQGTLDNPTPCSGVSPFRRSFWARAPYPTDQLGGWDTALWLGFAHLGARFVATHRPCFWYRQHGDSVFNVRRTHLEGFPATLTGRQLQARRRGDQGVSVVVPLAAGHEPEREAAWGWLRRRYAAAHPGWQVIEGRLAAGLWSKGAAVQIGLIQATGRVLVIADADCVVPAEALREAVALVDAGAAPWVVPHTTVHRLGAAATATYLTHPADQAVTPPPRTALARPSYEGFAGGGIVVVARAAYEATGGIPQAFVGWGGEDECLALILDTLLGPHRRLPYDLVHLWHPAEAAHKRAAYRHNRQLFQRFSQVAGDPARLWPLLAGAHDLAGAPRFAAQRFRALAAVAARGSGSSAQETHMPDTFAQRRLARAQAHRAQVAARSEASPRAVTLAQLQARRRQEARNRAAVEAAEGARVQAATLAELPWRERTQQLAAAKMHRGAVPEDKMDRGERVLDKAATPPAATLEGVAFASFAAQALAEAAQLDGAHFADRTPSSAKGFTAADVRELVA